MTKPLEQHEKIAVAIGTSNEEHNDIASVIIGMHPDAFEAIRDGRTHTVSLTAYGLPVEVIIFREPSLEACLAKLGQAKSNINDLPDLGIKRGGA